MDRFACYLPGWEMPKNSSEFLTDNYGFITDYLAEAFHYMFKHKNCYEAVSKRARFGKSVEGRDEKGIKKTICALMKILHPASQPTDEEFEEYAAYAVECRRRIKEQMNKRKPDVEFAKINLSYIKPDGTEIVIYCPESKDVAATQNPTRKLLGKELAVPSGDDRVAEAESAFFPAAVPEASTTGQEPKEQHYTIRYGDTGYSYESIIGPYLQNAREVTVEDGYIRENHQVQNFVRFCETVVKAGSLKRIILITKGDDETDSEEVSEKLKDLRQSLLELDVILEVRVNPNLHDREIRFDNGWVIKISRGLDIYQLAGSWFEIGALDLSLRKCQETRVDIYRVQEEGGAAISSGRV
jgi:ATP-dependent Lon protease